MKKNPVLFISMLFAGLLLAACDDSSKVNTSEEDLSKLAYADLTIEQNKEKIQDDALATMTKLDGMTNLKAVYALQDLNNLIGSAEMPEAPALQTVSKLLAPIAGMKKDVKGLTKLRSIKASIEEVSAIMDNYGGVYTYKPSTNEFTRVANSNEITFNFPIGTSSTNNGKLTINNVTVKTSTDPNLEGQEFPKTLNVNLLKSNASILSLAWTASYDENCVPLAMSTVLNFAEGYKFSQTFTNSKTDLNWEFSYTLNNANILSGKFNSKGTFDNDALSQEDLMDDAESLNLVLDSANVTVQLGNIKVTGLLGFDRFMTEFDDTFNGEMEGSESDYVKLARISNKYVKLYVLYADEKTVIAKSHFYKREVTDGYWSYYWNGNEYVQQWIEDSYFDMGLQFEFKDGSYYDQSFFDEGFDDLQTAFEDMINEFETSYGE